MECQHEKYTTVPAKHVNTTSENNKPILVQMNDSAEEKKPIRFTPVIVSDSVPCTMISPFRPLTLNESAIVDFGQLRKKATRDIFIDGEKTIYKDDFVKRMCFAYNCATKHVYMLPCVRIDSIYVKRKSFEKMFGEYGPLRKEGAYESVFNPRTWDDNGMKISQIARLQQQPYWKGDMSVEAYEECILKGKYRAVYARFATNSPKDFVNGDSGSVGGQRALVISHRNPAIRCRFSGKKSFTLTNIKYQRVRGCWMVSDDTSIRYYGTITKVLNKYSLALGLPLAQKESKQDEWVRLAEEMCK